MIRFYFVLFLMIILFLGVRTLFNKILPRYFAEFYALWLTFKNGAQDHHSQQHSGGFNKGKMTAEEAYNVLGLKAGASKADIIDAHRKLIQKNHPDRGGSDYLAAKINLAKKTLLKT